MKISLKINKQIILPIEPVKHFGIKVDWKLTFKEHMNLCNRANRNVKALNRVKNVLTNEQKKILFSSFLLPNFSYYRLIRMLWQTSKLSNESYP